ncbi:MAG TPA: hypothetical protein PKE38_13175 [Ignavibacteriaceae bacterium]|nr:hypothetical protein [Ignavibacteriaceae bacterium]
MNNTQMETEDINNNKTWIRNFSLSILLHLVVISTVIYFFNLQSERSKVNSSFFTIDTKEYVQQKSEEVKSEIEKNVDEPKEINAEKKNDVIEEIQSLSISDIIADTTNLDQVYSEPTLNVSIKYPKGWTFIDQNRKKIFLQNGFRKL